MYYPLSHFLIVQMVVSMLSLAPGLGLPLPYKGAVLQGWGTLCPAFLGPSAALLATGSGK